MMHKEVKVYVDDIIIKSRTQIDNVRDLRKFFERLRKYISSLIRLNVHLEFHLASFWVL